MLIPGSVASKLISIPPSAYNLFLTDDVEPDCYLRMNENSGNSLADSSDSGEVNNASNSQTNSQNALIVDYSDDAGSLDAGASETISIPDSIPISWNADGNTLETLFISFWVQVNSLAAEIDVLNSGDPTRLNIKIRTNGSVRLRFADIATNTSSAGDIVVGQPANISYWIEYEDLGFETFDVANIRGNINGNAISGSIGAGWDADRFPNLNLAGWTLGQFSGSIDEFILKYGNVAGGNSISMATGTVWCNAIPDF